MWYIGISLRQFKAVPISLSSAQSADFAHIQIISTPFVCLLCIRFLLILKAPHISVDVLDNPRLNLCTITDNTHAYIVNKAVTNQQEINLSHPNQINNPASSFPVTRSIY